MDPATIAAAASAAASLGGSFLQNRANKKAAEKAQQQRNQEIGMIQEYGQRSMDALLPSYQAAQNMRQQGMQQQLGLAGQTFQPMIEATQAGDYMAQQAMLDTLKQKQNARMTGDVDYSVFQPQNVPIDYSALSGLMNPQALEFAQFEQPKLGMTGGDIQKYLSMNPDIEQGYMASRAQLLAGGDPQFNTLEGYAKWHFDNYGKQEMAEGKRPPLDGSGVSGATQGVNVGSPQRDFTTDQIARIFNMGGMQP